MLATGRVMREGAMGTPGECRLDVASDLTLVWGSIFFLGKGGGVCLWR